MTFCLRCGAAILLSEGDPNPIEIHDRWHERDVEMVEAAVRAGTRLRPEVSEVFAALRRLTPYERSLVLCWFCDTCRRYVGPGDSCGTKCSPPTV